MIRLKSAWVEHMKWGHKSVAVCWSYISALLAPTGREQFEIRKNTLPFPFIWLFRRQFDHWDDLLMSEGRRLASLFRDRRAIKSLCRLGGLSDSFKRIRPFGISVWFDYSARFGRFALIDVNQTGSSAAALLIIEFRRLYRHQDTIHCFIQNNRIQVEDTVINEIRKVSKETLEVSPERVWESQDITFEFSVCWV